MQRVDPATFLRASNTVPVYTILGSGDLYHRTDGKPFDKEAFHRARSPGKGVNFLYADGHVDLVMSETVAQWATTGFNFAKPQQ